MSMINQNDSDKTPIFLHPRIKAQLFAKGQDLFNDEKYFEAHEEWEHLWRAETATTDRLFLQGLIQVAAHFVHLKKHSYGPAYRVALSALEKLAKPLPNNSIYLKFDLEPIVSGLHYNMQTLASLDESQSVPRETFLYPKLFDGS